MSYVYVAIDLENPKNRCMHLTRSRGEERSDFEFLAISIKALNWVLAC